LEDQKIVLKGDLEEQKGLFYIYHGRDERDPHSFLKQDPYI